MLMKFQQQFVWIIPRELALTFGLLSQLKVPCSIMKEMFIEKVTLEVIHTSKLLSIISSNW